MKIVEFDDKKNPRPAARERNFETGNPHRGDIKIREFGSASYTDGPGAPNIDVGRIKIREFGDEPSRRAANSSPLPSAQPSGSSGINKPQAFRIPDRASIKIVEFGEETSKPKSKPSAEPPRGMKIIASDK